MNCFFGPQPGDQLEITAYRVFPKAGAVLHPSDLFVLIEEAPFSINDGFFCFFGSNNPNGYTWSDYPGAYHGESCGVSFADGHSEIHKWVGYIAQVGNLTKAPGAAPSATNDKDYAWLLTHGCEHK